MGFEADAEVETPRCRVVKVVADLDSFGTGLGEQFDAGGEDVAGETLSLVIVLGAHGFDEPRVGLGVVPEQAVRGDVVTPVVHHQVEVGAVQRRLTKARLNLGMVPFAGGHVVRTGQRVEATEQPVALVEGADRWSSVCGQPRFDEPVVLGSEAMADQHRVQDVVGSVNLQADGFVS